MKRYAMVIGNGQYQSLSGLQNALHDAEDMAIKLEQLGFETERYTDVTIEQLTELGKRYTKQMMNYQQGVFYYAGHGMQIDGENYLVPIDCPRDGEEETTKGSYSLNELLEQLSIYGNKANVLILDACRNNPFSYRGSVIKGGFSPRGCCTKGTFIAFATSPGEGADDGGGRNGLYTGILKELIVTPDLPIEDLFKQVRMRVMEESDNEQISWEHSCLVGEFYFNPKQKNSC